MTRAEAAQIISQAIVSNGSSYVEKTLAQHIAAALDALGLLTYATDPHLNPHPRATSITQERSSHEEIAAAARIVSGDPLGQGLPPVATSEISEPTNKQGQSWAATRAR
jgi:hypothetical protein